ncbi:MAG: sigma 54-interacting transcriptional regulator [Blastocatellia bacterium]|nr:sigma 54-interacting transcriptional regulator [Blastocatellia bacterium]
MNPRLVTIAGPLKGKVFPLTQSEISFGRDPANQLCLNDLSVSRRHCLLQREGAQFILRDLGSLNCTFVNALPIKEQPLAPGDCLKVGDFLFLFLLDEDDAISASYPTQLDSGQVVTQVNTLLRPEEARLMQPEKTLTGLSPAARLARDHGVLLKLGRAINAAGSLEALQRQLLDFIFEVVPAERGAILLTGKNREEVISIFGRSKQAMLKQPMQVSSTIVSQVRMERAALLSNNVMESHTFGTAQSLVASHIHSMLAVPLVVFEKLIGILYLDSSNPLVQFDEEHLRLMTAVAGIAAVAIENVRRLEWLEGENQRLQEEIHLAHDMIGESPRMRSIFQTIAKVAPTDSTVLIRGESGTGKELVARAIHRNSPRASKPFVAINCAALTETLLESELFGYEKGAFTGAIAQKKGKFEIADGGTVFLDEMGEMQPALQAKLLRVLQEHEFERVGGTKPIKTNLRLIAATNRDLEAAIKNNTFRADLYYRLNVVSITNPPLRERREDIPALAQFFTAKYSQKCKRPVTGLSAATIARLQSYDWPGNVRELENTIERAVVLGSTNLIQVEDLPESILEQEPVAGLMTTKYEDTLRETKKQLVLRALEQANGNQAEAAKLLGMHASNLHRLIQNLKLK